MFLSRLLVIVLLFILSCGPSSLKIPPRFAEKITIPEKFAEADEVITRKKITYSVKVHEKTGKLTIIKHFEIDGLINKPENTRGFYRVRYENGFERVKMKEVFYINNGERINVNAIQDIKMNSDVFYDNSRAKIFAFKNIKKGTKYHYSYDVEYINLNVVDGIIMNDLYPVLDLSVYVDNKSPYDIEFKKTGDFSKFKEKEISKIAANSSDSYHYSMIDDFEIYKDYSMISKQLPSYHFFIESDQFIRDWNSMANYFFDLNKNNFVLSDKAYNDIISKITYSNDEEFIQNLFYYIQDNIRYVALVDGIKAFKADAPETVIKNKYGECKSMSFLLVSILRKKGFNAAPAIVNLGGDNLNLAYPKLYMANHCVAYVKAEKSEYWLDATGSYLKANAIIPALSEKRALVVYDQDKNELKETPKVDYKSNAITYRLDFELDGKNLKGKAKVSMASFSAYQFRNILQISHQMDAMDKMKSILNSQFENTVISNLEIENIKDPTKDLVLSFDISFLNAVNIFGNRQLINLNPISYLRSTKFSGGKHVGDFFYDKASIVNLDVNLKKAAEFNVKSKSEDLNFENEFISYSRKYKSEAENLRFLASYQINKTYFSEDDYSVYSGEYLKIKNAFNINIQLTKGE